MPRTSTDGRVLRGAQNRERIVDAVIELVRGGTPQPSADAIAASAGAGKRTVFRQFRDMEGLFRAVAARIQREVLPLIDQGPITGSRADRVAELVRRRVRVYEHLAPFRIAAMPHRRASGTIRRGQRVFDAWASQQLRDAFATELRGAPDDLLELLDAVTSFETWDRLRSAQRLGRVRAAAVVERGILALLASRSRSSLT